MAKKNKKEVYYDEIPILKKPGTSKIREQLSKGLGAIVIIMSGIILYFIMLRFTDLVDVCKGLLNLLTPFIYGVAIAYLLNPLMVRVDEYVYELLHNQWKWKGNGGKFTPKKVARVVGVAAAMAVFLSVVFLLISLIIPELIHSVENLIYTLPAQISAFSVTLSNIELTDGEMMEYLEMAYVEVVDYGKTWVQTELLTQVNSWMSNIAVGALSFVGWFFDFLMGIIIAVYILLSKETFLNQMKKIFYATMPIRRANITLHIMKKSNDIFGGFIIGKILDSMIIGIITFVAMMVMNMPYGLLISVVVGVTNVIPYFGPFIGAIPCAVLVLLQSPIQCVYFVIYIIVIQQIDGNIIGPKILGDSTGLSAFWVIFSILVGSGLFGFVGMVVGVPGFAVIYYIVKLFLDQRLEAKNLPIHSENYDANSYVDTQTGLYVSSKEVKEKEGKENADSSTE